MIDTRTASRQITETVTSWPDVEAGLGRRGQVASKLAVVRSAYLHGDHAAHFAFPEPLWVTLMEQGRSTPHPVFPTAQGPAARRIDSDEDIGEVIELMRLNYDRAAGR